MVVRGWLSSKKQSLPAYFERRAAEIKETTNDGMWYWVPTHDNAAHDASRWVKAASLQRECRWFKGPQFLTGPAFQLGLSSH